MADRCSRLACNPKLRFCRAIAHDAAVTRQGPRRGRTWTQTEDQPRELLSVRIGSDTTMDPGFASQLNDTCSSDPNAFTFLDLSLVGSEQVL